MDGPHCNYRSIAALVVAGVVLSASASHAAGGHVVSGGHGGGAGHTYAGGWHGAFGPGYRGNGYYGYPGYGYGYGYGFGLGLGLGYGYGYGYPYYGYGYPYYGYGYPVYAYPPGTTNPDTNLPPGWGAPPAPSGGMVAAPPPSLIDSNVVLWVNTPPDALVWVNGNKTNQTGPRRQFLSTGLAPGRTYTYDIQVQWKGPDGKWVDLAQHVSVKGGERRIVDFGLPMPPHADIAPVTNRPGR